MNSFETSGVVPENENTKFIDQLSSFGINDQKIINKLLNNGKIIDIDVSDDSIVIFYHYLAPHEKIIVRKSDVKKIDPQNGNITETQTNFIVDIDPEKNYPKRRRKVQKGALRRV